MQQDMKQEDGSIYTCRDPYWDQSDSHNGNLIPQILHYIHQLSYCPYHSQVEKAFLYSKSDL